MSIMAYRDLVNYDPRICLQLSRRNPISLTLLDLLIVINFRQQWRETVANPRQSGLARDPRVRTSFQRLRSKWRW